MKMGKAVRAIHCLMACLFWIRFCGMSAQLTPAEEELLNSVRQEELKWTSLPNDAAWKKTKMKLGFSDSVYQGCNSRYKYKTLWSTWIPRKDGHDLLLDLLFAQETEAQLSPLEVHLLERNTPATSFRAGQESVLQLTAPQPFSVDKTPATQNLHHIQGLHVGKVSQNGFHLGLSYAGPCIFIASVRLYYMKCPAFVENLVEFTGAAGGSGLEKGACVNGSVKISALERECRANGTWGALQGRCVCVAGYQEMGDSCEACRSGTYKPVNDSGGCHPCPTNSKTASEGAEECECMQGYSRLQSDPALMGCTRPPSAPENLAMHWLNDTTLALQWDPPSDLGGREEVTYAVKCSFRQQQSEWQWSQCGEAVLCLPASAGLADTAVNITGMDLHLDYRLSVRASNAVSMSLGSATSVNSITIHSRWKDRLIIAASPAPMDPSQRVEKPLSLWVIAGPLCGGLLLVALVPSLVCLLRRNYTQLSHDQEMELLPVHSGVVYRRTVEPESAPQQVNIPCTTPAQLLGGLSDRLLSSLKEVLVERRTLTLGKELGKGEFGAVYEGIFSPEQSVNVKVAVKTMKVGIHCHDDLESFLKEAEIMQHFSHDNVVKLLGVTLEQQQDSPVPVPLVILPFMKHGDLRRFLIATRYGDIPMFVPHQSLLRFMMDVAAGMEYLSSQGFLHRDLAARNCMLGDDLRVRVADFGLSKRIYSNNYYRQMVAIRMPVKWMAIESLSEAIYTTKSDVWSFGVTMWEIVSRGRTPYPGVPNHELLELLESGHRLKPVDCDSQLHELMLSCWHGDPAQRLCFGELGEKLKALLDELPPLEASKEAHYINLGLEAASQGSANGVDPELEEGAVGNVYLPAPVGSRPPPKEEEEEGYLLCIKSCAAHGPRD